MRARFAIHGLHRTGRVALRAALERAGDFPDIELVAVAGAVQADNLASLIQHDSVHGRFPGRVLPALAASGAATLRSGDAAITVLNDSHLPPAIWRELGVDVVVETDWHARHPGNCRRHLHEGARKVIVTGAAADADATILTGINPAVYDPARHHVVSQALPSTHSLAPLVLVLLTEGFGLEAGLLTTLRPTWEGQCLLDAASPRDWRGGRAAGVNLVPESNGAAAWVGTVLPAVKGRLSGITFIVPNTSASLAGFTVRTARPAQYAEISAAMEKASASYLRGILGFTRDPVVSSDFRHCAASCVFDHHAGQQSGDRHFKLVGWYDSEWGYACRGLELLSFVARQGI